MAQVLAVAHFVSDPLIQVNPVIHPDTDPQCHHRQGGHFQADAQCRHQGIAQDGHNRQGHEDAQHCAERAERQPAEQRDRSEQRRQHDHFGLFDRLIGRRHDPDIAARHQELHFIALQPGDDALGLVHHMADRCPFMIGQEHQNLHALTAFSHQPVIRHVSTRALAQAAFGAWNGRPARVAFVVAGNHVFAHAGNALHRLHTRHAAYLKIK